MRYLFSLVLRSAILLRYLLLIASPWKGRCFVTHAHYLSALFIVLRYCLASL